MELFMNLMYILVTSVLVENVVLAKFLGCCPFLGVSKKLDSAVGMSSAVIFVMLMATAVTWPIYTYLLAPQGLDYFADHRLHPGHCSAGSAGRVYPEKIYETSVPFAGCLPAADYHQLCSVGLYSFEH